MSIESELDMFTGTENYYKHHGLYGITLTDGIKYMAEKCNAYWLLDVINSHQTHKIRKENFQIWTLERKPAISFSPPEKCNGGVVYMRTDSDQPKLVNQAIEYTDFPIQKFECYLIDNVLLLKSEY